MHMNRPNPKKVLEAKPSKMSRKSAKAAGVGSTKAGVEKAQAPGKNRGTAEALSKLARMK